MENHTISNNDRDGVECVIVYVSRVIDNENRLGNNTSLSWHKCADIDMGFGVDLMDSQKRTIVKTLLWRLIASSTTVVVVFMLSGNIALGLTAAAIGIPLKLFMYYFYERGWHNVTWGRDQRTIS